MVKDYCENNDGNDDVLDLVIPLITSPDKPKTSETDKAISGYVYLIKSGKFYKIGYSSSVGRREYEISLQMPEKVTKIHAIETDDPAGIEAYWHRRFSEKRKNGEWFELDSSDVRAFKRRKFM